MNKLAVYLVVGLLSLSFAVPLAQAAGPGPSATLHCHGKPGSTATVSWFWTLRGTPITATSTITCTVGADGKGVAGPVNPGRPAQATDFHYTITVTPAGKKATTCGPFNEAVHPGFGFSVHDDCRAKDPTSGRFALSTPS